MSLCDCRCTRLTSLDLSMPELDTAEMMFTVGGLPEGITALQRLQRLRLGNCVTEQLTRGISRLTQLTSLEIVGADLCDEDIHGPSSVAVRCPPPSSSCLEMVSKGCQVYNCWAQYDACKPLDQGVTPDQFKLDQPCALLRRHCRVLCGCWRHFVCTQKC
jgi:hypothetical protein